VYRELMQRAGVQPLFFDEDAPVISKNFVGDLNKMLYGMAAKPQEWLEYKQDRTYFYIKDGQVTDSPDPEMVEENDVETVNADGSGNLLMYRDSFANSLIPYLSQSFSYAYYTKTVPYNMTDLVVKEPDYVIFEKAERHLPTFAEVPPIMSAPLRQIAGEPEETELLKAPLEIKNDGVYVNISGRLGNTDIVSDDSRIYISLDEGSGSAYEAFLTCTGNEEFGFSCYIPATLWQEQDILVIVESEGRYFEEDQPEAL
ncbi:MAG: hypothetical protein K6G22_07590, partial [Lachnospiraceae bacterium]|nr:hypothetical protein [Lachnospiraceae bacterium]